MPVKRSKYGVSPKNERTYNGKLYMSKLECNYRKHLDLLIRASNPKERVVKIEEQVVYEIVVNHKKICKYLLDFRVTYGDGRVECVDTKGVLTAIYRLKKKLLLATLGIEIKEVKRNEF